MDILRMRLSVLTTYCCVTNYLPKVAIHIYFVTVMNSGANVGCFGLRVCHEAVIKMSSGAVVICRLDCGWRLLFQSGSLLRAGKSMQLLA